MGYLQLINKLIEYDDADEAIVAELQRLFQALTPGDRDHFREVLDGTREPDDEDLPRRFSSDKLRDAFIGFAILNHPYKAAMEWLREYISMSSAQAILEGLQKYYIYSGESSDLASERDRKESYKVRRLAYRATKALEAGLIEPALVPYIYVYGESGRPADFVAELIIDQVTNLVQTERDKARLEKAIVFWDNVVSKITRRTLRRIYLDANLNTLEKANAARMLILLGDAQLTWSI